MLLEDVGWAIRWLVVDTGNWLPGRKVILPLSALGKPDRASRHFPVKLTMRQVKNSPDVDVGLPVSRRVETDLYDYYDWDPYWRGSSLPTSATPFAVRPQLSDAPPEAGHADAPPIVVDRHLRSIATLTGSDIQALDGEIGHVEDLLVEEAGWRVRYITVDTKNWWPGEKVLISPRSVREIDWTNRLVHLDVDRQKVKDSPPYDPAVTVDGAYDETLLTYYGIRWVAG
ncbi:MAG: PRC-barrel domain-containing protein [Pseudomonadota bacterium]